MTIHKHTEMARSLQPHVKIKNIICKHTKSAIDSLKSKRVKKTKIPGFLNKSNARNQKFEKQTFYSAGKKHMEKILLAINGTVPDKKTFTYAVDLCKRMKADLKILQVINPKEISGYLATLKTKAKNTTRYMEDAMMAATFAEAGEYETACYLMAEGRKNVERLLPESIRAGIACDIAVKTGNTNKEIANYVRKNKDIVITVYDTPRGDNSKKTVRKINNDLKVITRALPVPVVMVQVES